MESIIASLITGLLALVGVIYTNSTANKRIASKLETAQEVTNAKLEHLTEEVRQHNSFAIKIPELEVRLNEQERRLRKLEDNK